ncbi:MAG: excisionase family DNA-binding protein [Saprospiraceae bacterium]
MSAVLERTTKREQIIAKESLSQIDRIAALVSDSYEPVKVQVSNHEVVNLRLPAKVVRVIKSILNLMAEGKAFSVIPEESELSTKQAADILNVSRPHLVKLLEAGEIPFRKTGSHRRVLLQDLMVYIGTINERRERILQELANEAQQLGLGY